MIFGGNGDDALDLFGKAWLLDKLGNCIEVYAHPSESFEFDSVVDLVSKYGSELDKANCLDWNANHSDILKMKILCSYNRNWCKIRLWKDNKLTFRITSTDFNWYQTIIDFLLTHQYMGSASISVSDISGRIYWNDLSYSYCIDPSNKDDLFSLLQI